jgi:hypothetical protein
MKKYPIEHLYTKECNAAREYAIVYAGVGNKGDSGILWKVAY